ncbi:GAF domain-containing protein [Nonomuraea sp. PA05]|uniref:GAF domain-containing protein n=1 Tax=Nonomuraea sp. PA05 TaxID=2604466 RepID=UPI001651C17C|nr:GAF domain-containing protein [Nonomuraea sp. PA05]
MDPDAGDLKRQIERLIARTRAARRRAEELRLDAAVSRRRVEERETDTLRRLERQWANSEKLGELGLPPPPARPHADPGGLAEAGLRAALALTGADMGTVHLLDSATGALTIVAGQGFQQPFLGFFAVVDDDRPACGRAMATRKAVAVRDVEQDRLLAGTPASRVLREAEVRAVYSAPLLDRYGTVLGVLSVHHRQRHEWTRQDHLLLRLLSRHLSHLLSTTDPRSG